MSSAALGELINSRWYGDIRNQASIVSYVIAMWMLKIVIYEEDSQKLWLRPYN